MIKLKDGLNDDIRKLSSFWIINSGRSRTYAFFFQGGGGETNFWPLLFFFFNFVILIYWNFYGNDVWVGGWVGVGGRGLESSLDPLLIINSHNHSINIFIIYKNYLFSGACKFMVWWYVRYWTAGLDSFLWAA